jgi:arylsulfatase A-like enzyme
LRPISIRAWFVLFCCSLVLVAGLVACGGGGEGVVPPNVIVITMDTMRSDHLGCYGYERPTSPEIDRFAASAVFYPRSVASSPWTVPSHASLFTGKDPFEHGAHTLEPTRRDHNINPLHHSHTTLAEALLQEGYSTAAFVANDGMLALRWQLDQGFQIYHVERTLAEVLNQRVFAWLDSMAVTQAPFFLFVNYMDTHKVYNTKPRPGFLPEPAVQDRGQLLEQLYETVMPGTGPVPQELARMVIDQYDTAIANLDEQVGLFLDRLRGLGLYDNTVIVLTSDHGEFFGEHLLVTHSKDVYQEVLGVPLVVKEPGQREGRRDETTIVSSDIPRMILSRFPREIEQKYASVFPNAPGDHPVIAENYYTRAKDLFHPVWGKRFRRVRTVLYEWPYKYIHSSDGRSELYHLEYDYGESVNLFGNKPELAGELREKMELFMQRRGRFDQKIDQRDLTEDEIRKLKSLGYIGD